MVLNKHRFLLIKKRLTDAVCAEYYTGISTNMEVCAGAYGQNKSACNVSVF
jgi:hypothetical protein